MAPDEDFLQSLAGTLVIAGFMNWVFMGVLAVQILAYYLAFPKDRLVAKTLVYTVFALEIAQTTVVSHDIYTALAIAPSGDHVGPLDSIHNHWFSIPVAGGVSGGIGQLFFAYRVWIIAKKGTNGQITSTSGSRGPSIVIAFLAVASLCSALVSAEAFFRAKTFSALLGVDGTNGAGSLAAIGVWNGIGAICDIVIALSMPYYIMRHGTGLRSTHIMVVKLVRLIIETGIFTAVIAILHLCLYFGSSQYFIIPGLTLSKVYANTMLVLLNNRMTIADGRSHGDRHDSHISSALAESPRTPIGGFREPQQPARQARSTILVSNDRLTFRLDDMPPVPHKSLGVPRNEHSSDAETTSDAASMHSGAIHHVRLPESKPFDFIPMNTKV